MARNDTRGDGLLELLIKDLEGRFQNGEEVVTKEGVERINPSAATIKATVELLDKLGRFDLTPPDNNLGALAGRMPFPKGDK